MLIKRKDFIRIGGWDENFWMYYEDMDICKRAKKHDIATKFYNDLLVMSSSSEEKVLFDGLNNPNEAVRYWAAIGLYNIYSKISNKSISLLKEKLIEDEIIINKKKLKKLKPEYKEQSTLFHSKAEVEGLYQSLSRYAGVNGLTCLLYTSPSPRDS